MGFSTHSSPSGAEPLTFIEMIDQTTIISLLSTLAILFTALGISKLVLDKHTPGRLRFLFVWHAFDALIHFILEGSFVWHCLFSSTSVREVKGDYFPTPYHYLGQDQKGRVWGSQAAVRQEGYLGAMAQLWMVYAKADRRWAGVDLATLSIEIITVVFGGVMAVLVCWDLARKNVARGNLASEYILGGGGGEEGRIANGRYSDHSCDGRVVWWVYDFYAGMVERERQLGYEQLYVQVDFLGLFQCKLFDGDVMGGRLLTV